MNNSQVTTVHGGYHVTLNGRPHFVNKQRRCSCHKQQCQAIKAVTDYLRAGGQRAPELADKPSNKPGLTCPVCGAATTGTPQQWRCVQSNEHYHRFRVNQIRAAAAERLAWLKAHDPEQYELAVFFMDAEKRSAFLTSHALTYPAAA